MSFDDTNLVDLLRRHAETNPEGVFARFNGEPKTFATLNAQSDVLAARLRTRGLKAGDRVAVMMRNSAEAGAFGVPGRGMRQDVVHTYTESGET